MSQLLADVAGAAGSWATVGLFLLGVGGLTFTAKRWLTKNLVERVQQIPGLVEDVGNLKHDIAAVKAELSPNGGSSMRDSTNRSEALATSIAEKVGVPIPEQKP